MLSLAFVTALAFALRYHDISRQPLWVDEAVTITYAKLSLYELWLTAVDVNAPLYYTVQKIFLLFGDSELALRIGSAIAGTLTVPVIYALGHVIAGRMAGLCSAAFLATAMPHVQYSQEARCYALLFLLLSLSVLGLVRFLRIAARAADVRFAGAGGWALALYVVTAALALYTHYTAAFWVICANALLLVFSVVENGRVRASNFRLFLAANVVLLVLWAPGAWVFAQLLQANTFQWLAQPSFSAAVDTLVFLHSFEYLWRGQPWADLMLTAFIVGGLVFAWRTSPAIGAVLLSVIVIAPTLMWLVGFHKPVFMPRTVLWGLIGSSAAVGTALAMIPRLSIAFSFMALVAAGNGISTLHYYEIAQKENWDDAADFIASQTSTEDTIILCNEPIVAPLAYYLIQNQTPRTFLVYSPSRRDFTRILPFGSQGGPSRQDQLLDTFRLTRSFPFTPTTELIGKPRIDAGMLRVPAVDDQALTGSKWLVMSHCSEQLRAELLAKLHSSSVPDEGWAGHQIAVYRIK